MAIMEDKERLEIKEEQLTFAKLINDAPVELAQLIKGKGLIVLPSHGSDDAFYAGSLDTLDYFNASGVDSDIYSLDDDYKELSLHGADLWIGTFFISSILIPVFCNLMSSYIYDKLKAKKDDKVSLKVIVERRDGTSVSVSFDGGVEGLGKAFEAVRGLESEV